MDLVYTVVFDGNYYLVFNDQMKKILLLLIFLLTPSADAKADDVYEAYKKEREESIAKQRAYDDEFNSRHDNNPFDTEPMHKDDEYEKYKNKTNNDLYNGMSPKGKSSREVLEGLFKKAN